MKIGVRTFCMRTFEIVTPSSQPPSTISMAMPAITRAFGSTRSLKITELVKVTFSKPPRVAVPNFRPLQQQVSTQLVMVMFFETRTSGP